MIFYILWWYRYGVDIIWNNVYFFIIDNKRMFRSQIDKIKAMYPIITGEDKEILRTKCKPVESVSSEIKEFWENLMELMWEYDGVGLAAPQINQDLRMCAISLWKNNKRGEENIWEEVLINPEIIDESEKEIVSEEACLSLPNITGKVMRKERIVVKYINLKGQEITRKLKWFNGIIAQHEIDHLNGILFIDKLID